MTEEIKIESFPMLKGELGLEPEDDYVWFYKAFDVKTQKCLEIIVDTPNRPDKETEEKIYTHIAYAFKRAEKEQQ